MIVKNKSHDFNWQICFRYCCVQKGNFWKINHWCTATIYLNGLVYLAFILGMSFSNEFHTDIRDIYINIESCNEVLLGDQAWKYGVTIQSFRDCLCLHHQGWCHNIQSLWKLQILDIEINTEISFFQWTQLIKLYSLPDDRSTASFWNVGF
jgi:hypothetical protein